MALYWLCNVRGASHQSEEKMKPSYLRVEALERMSAEWFVVLQPLSTKRSDRLAVL